MGYFENTQRPLPTTLLRERKKKRYESRSRNESKYACVDN
jgi:hypothetical protein